jgi:hypothetical protein
MSAHALLRNQLMTTHWDLRGRTLAEVTAKKLLSAAAVTFCTSKAFACSGPGAIATIRSNERLADLLLLLCLLLLPISLLIWKKTRRHRVWAAAHVLLIVVNPVWWIGALSGDCGRMLAAAAAAVAVVAGLGTARVVWLYLRKAAPVP